LKVLIESTSSPKKSIRKGRSAEYEKRSAISSSYSILARLINKNDSFEIVFHGVFFKEFKGDLISFGNIRGCFF
jgi:hypothetical protein